MTMTKEEALKLALSTLDEVRQETFRLSRDGQKLYAEDKVWSTIISIKEALAQPEQEPVVESFMVHMYNFGYKAGHHDTVEGQYIDLDRRDMGTYHSDIVAEWVEDVGYHTTTPQRKPLTSEEIWKFWWSRPEVPEGEDDSMEAEFVAAVRAVLAAHGIKE